MTKKVYVITDLGPGNGGKGGVVHKIANMIKPHTIIKEGGAQGSHGVKTSKGQSFAFSQWGCGTFEGIKTHISERLITSPVALFNEAQALRYKHGIHRPYDLLTVDARCLCATPYHKISSRIRELARSDNPRGTVGTGVGQALRYHKQYPELSIFMADLKKKKLYSQLLENQMQVNADMQEIIETMDFLADDKPIVEEMMELLSDKHYLDYILQLFMDVGELVKIVPADYVAEEVLQRDGTAIIERSHGVLTDNRYGFKPHTSAIRTLPQFCKEMLDNAGYDAEIINIAVSRAYQIRPGVGPIPTADESMTASLLPGSYKSENRYEGKMRIGPLDLVQLRYALEVCGGPSTFDALAITWFDQIMKNGEWQLCERYRKNTFSSFFDENGNIRLNPFTTDEEHRNYQLNLTKAIFSAVPGKIVSHRIKTNDRDENFSLCSDVLKEKLGIDTRMLSFGPSEVDKICK